MKKKIQIEGMSCNHCVAHVKEALKDLCEIGEVEVNLQDKYALLETTSDDSVIKEAIEDAGYDVINIENL